VLVAGDSQTEALMVGDDEAFPSLTEAALKADGAQMPVILNSGRSSASMADYVVGAPRFKRLFAPRWVILEIQESDLGEDAFDQRKAHFVDEGSGVLGVVPEKIKTRSVLNALLWTLRQNSMLIGYAAVRVVEFSQPASPAPALFQAGSSTAVLAPRRAYPVEAELDLAESVYRGRVSFLFLSPFDPKQPSSTSPFERRFLAHCGAAKLHCLTPRAEYPAIAGDGHAPYGHENTRFNSGHLNRIGHRAVAAALTRHIRELRADGLL
jgi:lysophospholipase L1-like esterase